MKVKLSIVAMVLAATAATNVHADHDLCNYIGRHLGWGVGDGYHVKLACTCCRSSCQASSCTSCEVGGKDAPTLAPMTVMPEPTTVPTFYAPANYGWLQRPVPRTPVVPTPMMMGYPARAYHMPQVVRYPQPPTVQAPAPHRARPGVLRYTPVSFW